MGSSVSIGLANLSDVVKQSAELLDDKAKLRELWKRADENSNGYVTLAEFTSMISEADEDDSVLFSDFDNEKAIKRCVKFSMRLAQDLIVFATCMLVPL